MSLAGKGQQQEETKHHNFEKPLNNNTSGEAAANLLYPGGSDRTSPTNRQPIRAGSLVLQAFQDGKGAISPHIVLKEWTRKLVSVSACVGIYFFSFPF
jgi:hypothetical protein